MPTRTTIIPSKILNTLESDKTHITAINLLLLPEIRIQQCISSCSLPKGIK